jgi:predicted kinase
LIACGLPGTGKSFLGEALSARSGWPVVSSDVVRKELAGCAPPDRLPLKFYRPEFSEKTYGEVIGRACAGLERGCVIADANFPSAALRSRAAAAGREAGGKPVVVWVRADGSVVRERLGRRAEDVGAASDADLAVYEKLEATFEPPSAAEGIDLIEIDGARDADANLNELLAKLLED